MMVSNWYCYFLGCKKFV